MLPTQAVEPATLGVLKELIGLTAVQNFSLTGGTALALLRGHRKSVDLDFFSPESFDTEELFEEIRTGMSEHTCTITDQKKNKLGLDINQIKVEFIAHRYPLLAEPLTQDGIRLFSLADIAAMKLNAATNRGSKKDFFDLVELLKVFSLSQMLNYFMQKYNHQVAMHVVRSLTYFEDAEVEPDPVSLYNITWADVKDKMEKSVREYLKNAGN